MKSISITTIAAIALALPLSVYAQGSGAQNGWADGSSASTSGGEQEAMRMVPAQGSLMNTLDAKNAMPGDEFRMKLSKTARLDDGTKLASGTVLVGKVTQDDMQMAGTSKLALRFTEADLKDGRTIPIRATIVGFARPEMFDSEDYPVEPGDQISNDWNQRFVAINQIDALPHVDLHSRIASSNSGVFVANGDRDVKLKAGSELEVAIAPSNGSQSGLMGGAE